MDNMKDVHTSTMAELRASYEFGAGAIREFMERGETLSTSFVDRFLEITDEILRRSSKEDQNEEKTQAAPASACRNADGLSDSMSTFITAVADNVFGIVWSSGIQILLFLAALQTIPPSAKEAATMEGATAWEYFWKITFPYVGPYILANLIFTVIDSFTNPMNDVMGRISAMRSQFDFGEAASMAWIYFVIVLAAIGVVTGMVRKYIYYEND